MPRSASVRTSATRPRRIISCTLAAIRSAMTGRGPDRDRRQRRDPDDRSPDGRGKGLSGRDPGPESGEGSRPDVYGNDVDIGPFPTGALEAEVDRRHQELGMSPAIHMHVHGHQDVVLPKRDR